MVMKSLRDVLFVHGKSDKTLDESLTASYACKPFEIVARRGLNQLVALATLDIFQ